MSRRFAREAAMCLFFEYSITNKFESETLETMRDVFEEEGMVLTDRSYITRLIAVFQKNQEEIDAVINQFSRAWNTDRIAKIDLSILRIAFTEILHMPDIPEKVSVNEAIELAKKYSTANSPRFINGLLGAYLKEEAVIE